jgi:hypothetical protein
MTCRRRTTNHGRRQQKVERSHMLMDWQNQHTDFKLYNRALAIKTEWYWHKCRYEDQWNRIEDTDMNPCSYDHLIFDKCAKNIQCRKTSFSTNVAGKSGYLPAEN